MNAPASTRTTVVWVPDWPVEAAVHELEVEPHLPVAVHDARRVLAVSAIGRAQGVRRGMRRRQAQGCCPELVLVPVDAGRDMRLFEPVAAAVEEVVAGIEVARPGLLLLPAGGAARYHGSEQVLAERLVTVVTSRTGYAAHVGIADGLLTAVLAAHEDACVPAGRSRAYLASRGVEDLAHAVTGDDAPQVDELVDLLRRLGLRRLGDLAGLPQADVHARFGRLGAWAHLLARGEDVRPPARRRPETDLEASCALDPPADRVDVAAFAGRRLAEELHDQLAARSAACGRLRIAARTDTGHELVRTWRADLGGLGGLSAARITDRLRWQLEGWMTSSALAAPRGQEAGDPDAPGGADGSPAPAALVHLSITAEDVRSAGAEQPRLWGGPSGGDLRAHRALDRVQGLVGGAGVLTATLQGGRDVRDQVHLRTWGEQSGSPRPADQPWPGRLPAPAPATVLDPPVRVHLLEAAGRPVHPDARGLLGADPAVVVVPAPEVASGAGAGAASGAAALVGRWAVVGWAGPWPLHERWWAGGTRRQHLQVCLADGRALLLVGSADGWVCEAGYD